MFRMNISRLYLGHQVIDDVFWIWIPSPWDYQYYYSG